MILLGRYNTLLAARVTPQGFYLEDGQGGEVLLPNKFVSETLVPGNTVEVFVYKDSEDRIVATTQKPLVEYGKVAVLEVVEASKIGAFLDWGLDKHLLLPHSEQNGEIKAGQKVAIVLFVDIKTKRLAASQKIDRYLKNIDVNLTEGQKVNLIVFRETPLGYSVVIENKYMGLVHHSHAFKKFSPAEELTGYVLKIRPDNNIDIILNQPGFEGHDEAVERILNQLQSSENGFLPFNDNSTSEDIANQFNMSKKLFKKSIGTLYKKQRIRITEQGIELVK
jgi:hypothetical protein